MVSGEIPEQGRCVTFMKQSTTTFYLKEYMHYYYVTTLPTPPLGVMGAKYLRLQNPIFTRSGTDEAQQIFLSEIRMATKQLVPDHVGKTLTWSFVKELSEQEARSQFPQDFGEDECDSLIEV